MAEPTRRWLLDAVIMPSVLGRHLVNDPGQFAAQLARRFRFLARWVRPADDAPASVTSGIRWFIVDEPARARAALSAPASSRLGRRIADELLIQLGEMPHGSAHAQARALAYRGDVDLALDVVGPSFLRRLWRDERHLLTPGARLRRLPTTAWAPRPGPRVLFTLTNSLPHTQSGYTARTHQILTALQRDGVDVEAVTRIGYPATVGRWGTPDVEVIDGVAYRRLRSWRYPWRVAPRLWKQADLTRPVAQKFRPTILHTTTDYTNALVTYALAQATNLPWVYELRGQLELSWAASRQGAAATHAPSSERVRLLRAKEAELASAANAVVVLSNGQRDDMIVRGVNPDRIFVVPNSVSDAVLERTPVDPADARAKLGLPREGLWIGSVTSVVDYEGLETIVDVVGQLRARGLDVRAAIVGDGVSLPSLRRRVTEAGLDAVVVLPGRVPQDQALAWHEALDVFMVPRKDVPVCQMVTPLKPLEAMALGRPVVASDLSALREIVADAGAGMVCDSGKVVAFTDAVEALVHDPELRRRYAEAGREFARSRTWESAARQLRGIYLSMEGER